MALLEISHEIRPQGLQPPIIQSGLEINLEPQAQEARDDMTDPGVIPLLLDRSYLKGGFLLAKRALNSPQFLVGLGHLTGREARVGREHERAIQTSTDLDRLLVHGDITFRFLAAQHRLRSRFPYPRKPSTFSVPVATRQSRRPWQPA
jgi:hypothetical protein